MLMRLSAPNAAAAVTRMLGSSVTRKNLTGGRALSAAANGEQAAASTAPEGGRHRTAYGSVDHGAGRLTDSRPIGPSALLSQTHTIRVLHAIHPCEPAASQHGGGGGGGGVPSANAQRSNCLT